MSIIDFFSNDSNLVPISLVIIFSTLRVYLEIISFKFENLPLSSKMFGSKEEAVKFHKWGLYICVLNLLILAPSVLLM